MAWLRSALGVSVAIAVSAAMEANGLANYTALPLFPLMALFWTMDRMSRRDIGFAWGRSRDYLPAVLYPIVVLSIISATALATGATDRSHAHWQHVWINAALLTMVTVLLAIITEEGFFRGWLWASLTRAGVKPNGVLVCTSVAFALWHISSATLPGSQFKLPAPQVPIYIFNAVVIGAVWGLLREMSGSILVSSVSHGFWNGLAYEGFGEGANLGALGIGNTTLFGPEVGYLGLVLNLIVLVTLWRWRCRRGKRLCPRGA
jgi:membrane protease YdiL (CAAX protease family)